MAEERGKKEMMIIIKQVRVSLAESTGKNQLDNQKQAPVIHYFLWHILDI